MNGNKPEEERIISDAKIVVTGGTDTDEEKDSSRKTDINESKRRLTYTEIKHLLLLVLAYAALMCQATSIVGTSAVLVLSVGGTSQTAPFALGSFLFGSAIVSLLTSRLFRRGRRLGFVVGTSLGLLGALLGSIAIVIESSVLAIVSCFPIGAANGIGMYLRFAAVEVVPASHKSFAITLVLSGGCIAAFAGPESVQATKDLFGDELLYLGVFMMIAIFNVCQSVFVWMVQFPSNDAMEKETMDGVNVEEESGDWSDTTLTVLTTTSVISSRPFLMSLAISTLAWSIMIMPMSVVRVAMGQVGYSSRQSLTVMELHFLSMYAPGFVTSKIIDRLGPMVTSVLSITAFACAMPFNLLTESEEGGTRATWILGLMCLGVGWNLGFASGTVLLTSVHAKAPHLKSQIEAANDFGMFMITGGFTFSTGYIFDAGGSSLSGWRTVNFVVAGLIFGMSAIVASEYIIVRRERIEEVLRRKNNELTSEKHLVTEL